MTKTKAAIETTKSFFIASVLLYVAKTTSIIATPVPGLGQTRNRYRRPIAHSPGYEDNRRPEDKEMTEVKRLKGQMCDGCIDQMDRATAKVVKSSATLTIEPGLSATDAPRLWRAYSSY